MAKKEIGNIQIENGRIMFRNFGGKETKFNPAGKRNFCALIDDNDLAEQLIADGWNVKWLQPRDENEEKKAYLQVGVNYDTIPPKIFMVCGRKKTLLEPDSVGALDWAEIKNVDMIIRPYEWEMGGKSGVKAYLKTMYVTIEQDRFEAKYEFPDDDEGTPFDM